MVCLLYWLYVKCVSLLVLIINVLNSYHPVLHYTSFIWPNKHVELLTNLKTAKSKSPQKLFHIHSISLLIFLYQSEDIKQKILNLRGEVHKMYGWIHCETMERLGNMQQKKLRTEKISMKEMEDLNVKKSYRFFRSANLNYNPSKT